MEGHIGFFKIGILLLMNSIIIGCSSDKQIQSVDEYFNFSSTKTEIKDTIKYISKIIFDKNNRDSISYIAEIIKSETSNKVLKSNFIFKNKQLKTPVLFKNFKDYNFEYSLMPKYSDDNLVAKKFNFDKKSVLIIRGENPFCNGSNCQSYFLHLLVFDNSELQSNIIYNFNYEDEKFEDFKVILKNDEFSLINNKNEIDTIQFPMTQK